jgi:hypothetical protein
MLRSAVWGRPEMTGRAVRVTRLTHNPRPGSKSLYLALGIAGALVGARVGCFGIWFSWFRNNNRYDPRGGAFHNWLAAVTEALSRRMRQRRRLPIKHLGCDTHQTGALDVVRRPKATPVHELERYMRCKDCSQVRCYPYKRSHLVALRPTKISASDPPSTWWPGER